jgi:hypothetical protein
MVRVTGTLTAPKTVPRLTVPVYDPGARFVVLTERVAVEKLNVGVLRNPGPEIGVKLADVICCGLPLKVTWTFWELTPPPWVALKVIELGKAATPLPPPVLPTVRFTLIVPN